MTETQWKKATDPTAMLAFVAGAASERKLRLFAAACARAVWDHVPEGWMREAVGCAERYADGRAAMEEVGRYRDFLQAMTRRDATPEQLELVFGAKKAVYAAVFASVFGTGVAHTLTRAAVWRAFPERHALLPALIRDLFGNPHRPAAVDPRWLTSAVVDLARTIYDSRDFAAMPILADALEEAGCDNTALLSHCRSGGPHVRGCWAVDLVLGNY